MNTFSTVITPAAMVPSSFEYSRADEKPVEPADYTPNRDPATVDVGTGLFTYNAHGLAAGDRIVIKDGHIPVPMVVDTPYYVIAAGLTVDDFKLSSTPGGSAIDLVSASGTFSWNLAPDELAEISTLLDFLANGGHVPPPPTLPYAIAKIAEWQAYYEGAEYRNWWMDDQILRAKAWISALRV